MSAFIIAEAGVNHNGSVLIAKKMVDAAVDAGADAIKFQTFIAEKSVSKFAKKADYQINNTNDTESQLEMVKNLELSFDDFRELHGYCKRKGIMFLSAPFDTDSIAFLENLNIEIWKIPSGEITNLPNLIQIAKTRKPVILSTGMSELEEIEAALRILRENGTEEITLLHCNTEYPTPLEDANLLAINTLKEKFGCGAGYSDHTQGIETAIAAAALGADIIEKLFTLDRSMEGPDHIASLEPDELKAMINCIRNVEKALGSGIKTASESERKNIKIARKSIIAKRNIRKGEVFTEENLTTKRPGDGISPMKWFELLGQTAERDFAEDEMIENEGL